MKQHFTLFAAILAAIVAAYHAAAPVDASIAPSSNPSSALPAQNSTAAASIPNSRPVVPSAPKRANFELERASHEARHVADWVVDSDDNKGMPFAIVDKTDAKVFVFNADGRLRGASDALLGLARGDDSVPGIGDRPLSRIRPDERTTAAGRFEVAMGPSLSGGTVLWLDYDEGLALHSLRPAHPKERRPQRLASPTPLDNRISYGCVVVPPKYFDSVVRPAFARQKGIVYVLPETKPAGEVFASYDVEARARVQIASQAESVQLASPSAPR